MREARSISRVSAMVSEARANRYASPMVGPHRPGEDGEREIERSTDPPEERGGEIASGHGG